MKRAVCATLHRLLWLAILASVANPWSAATEKTRKALPVDLELARLQICLSGDSDLQALAVGLMSGYQGGGSRGYGGRGEGFAPSAPPPPPEYMASLDRDFDACSYAFHLKDAGQRRELLQAIRRDIEVKSKDCAQFGMGRLVPVRITTVHGTGPENGWAAFYKWSSVSSFPVAELRVPGLTSPATLNLPPGVYSFRAEMKTGASDLKTDVVTVPIGGQKLIDVQLPVP